jgi:hypothetical protein
MGAYICEHCEQLRESREDGYHEVKSIWASRPWACCMDCLPEIMDEAATLDACVTIDDMSLEEARALYA